MRCRQRRNRSSCSNPPKPDLPQTAQLESGYAPAPDAGLNRRRLGALAATLAVEILIIALLLTLGWGLTSAGPEAQITTISAESFAAEDDADEASEPAPSEAPQAAPAETEPVERPFEIQPPVEQRPAIELPSRVPILREDFNLPPAPTAPPPSRPPSASAAPSQAYGPQDTGPQTGSMDSQRVGTAPNGEPMYAARWYREPTQQQMAGYLSTADAPSSALIVCRTVPNYFVEDCELLGESPRGSQIGRAALAAAWQFRVRPAVIAGRSQVGSWVRIRIDYTAQVRR